MVAPCLGQPKPSRRTTNIIMVKFWREFFSQSYIYIATQDQGKKKKHRNWEREKGTLPESRHAFDVSIHRIKLLAMEMFKVYDNMAHEYLCQIFLKMRSTLGPRAPLLDFSCLFPKPIMATTRKKHFGYRGAFISNKLLEDLREWKVNELI